MNQKFLNTSLVIYETMLPASEREHLWHLSVKLAWKGAHKLYGHTEDNYHRKLAKRKVEKDTVRIYRQLLADAEKEINKPIYDQ